MESLNNFLCQFVLTTCPQRVWATDRLCLRTSRQRHSSSHLSADEVTDQDEDNKEFGTSRIASRDNNGFHTKRPVARFAYRTQRSMRVLRIMVKPVTSAKAPNDSMVASTVPSSGPKRVIIIGAGLSLHCLSQIEKKADRKKHKQEWPG